MSTPRRSYAERAGPDRGRHQGQAGGGRPQQGIVEGGSRQSQIAVMPPSTARSTPAMKLASSDARNKAVDAISSGRPSRPNGTATANWTRILAFSLATLA